MSKSQNFPRSSKVQSKTTSISSGTHPTPVCSQPQSPTKMSEQSDLDDIPYSSDPNWSQSRLERGQTGSSYNNFVIKESELGGALDTIFLRGSLRAIFDGHGIQHTNNYHLSWSAGLTYTAGLSRIPVDKPVDHDFGLPPAPPSSPKPRSPALTNAEFLARATPPPALPRPDPEDYLGVRKEITECLGGAEVRKFVEDVQLSHTVQVRLSPDNWRSDTPLPYRIFALSEVDTIEKLKKAICQNFGRELSRKMQVGCSAQISGVTISYTPAEGPKNGLRQVVSETQPAEHGGRLYTTGATRLKTEITHHTLDCCCGECDNIIDVPEILVQLRIFHREARPSRPKLKRHHTALQKKHLAKLKQEGIIPYEDIVIKLSKEARAQQLSDHGGPLRPRILVDAEVFRNMQDRLLKVPIQDAENKKLRAQIALLEQQSDPTVLSSVSNEGPPSKRSRLNRSAKLKRSHRGIEQELPSLAEDQEADDIADESVTVEHSGSSVSEKELNKCTEADQRAIREAMGLKRLTRSRAE